MFINVALINRGNSCTEGAVFPTILVKALTGALLK